MKRNESQNYIILLEILEDLFWSLPIPRYTYYHFSNKIYIPFYIFIMPFHTHNGKNRPCKK